MAPSQARSPLQHLQSSSIEDPLLYVPSSAQSTVNVAGSSSYVASSLHMPLHSPFLPLLPTPATAPLTSTVAASWHSGDRQSTSISNSPPKSLSQPTDVCQHSDEPVTALCHDSSKASLSPMASGSQDSCLAYSSHVPQSSSPTPNTSTTLVTSTRALSQLPSDSNENQVHQHTCNYNSTETPPKASHPPVVDNDVIQRLDDRNTTETHDSINPSSLRMARCQSGDSVNSSPRSSSIISRQSTPTIDPSNDTMAVDRSPGDSSGHRTRLSTSKSKTPPETCSQPTADEGVAHHSNEPVSASHNTGTHQTSTGDELDCSTRDGVEQAHTKPEGNARQMCRESRSSKSLRQPSELRQKRVRSVRRYSSSEEFSDESLNEGPKTRRTRRSLPPKKEKKKKIDEKQSTAADKAPSAKNTPQKQKTGKPGTGRKKAEFKRESVSVLKSKAQVRYPGYSSGWSSPSDSETNKDVTVEAQAKEEKENLSDQHSNPTSVKSTISTSSWTSSEGDNEEHQLQGKVMGEQSESRADGEGSGVGQVGLEHEDVPNKECDEEGDNGKVAEDSVPLAPESVDMDMEPQPQENTGTSQHEETSQVDVTVIPETQEALDDVDGGLSSELVTECPGSPVIPLQNGSNTTEQVNFVSRFTSPGKCSSHSISPKGETAKTAALLRKRMSMSDIDSHLIPPSVTSDKSCDQTRKEKRKRLLEKIKKRHILSDVGDSASSTDSRGIDSCLRRKVKLSAKVFGTYRMKKPSNKPPSKSSSLQDGEGSATEIDSSVEKKSRSDTEFVRLSSTKNTTAPVRKVIPTSIDKGDKDNGQKSDQTATLTEDRYVGRVVSKQKKRATACKESSEPTFKEYTVKKKVNSKKRTSKEVIEVSSESESGDFKPPPFKKRKPLPNFLRPRKTKPTLLDDLYNSKPDTTENLKSGNESCHEKDSDSELTGDVSISKQPHPTTVEVHHQGTTKTAKMKTAAQTTKVTSTGSSKQNPDCLKSPRHKLDGNLSSKQNSAVAQGKSHSESDADVTSRSESSDSNGETDNRPKEDARDSPLSKLDKTGKISNSTKTTDLLDQSRSSTSSSSTIFSDEERELVIPSTTHHKPVDDPSIVGRPLDRTSKTAKSSLQRKKRETAVNKIGGAMPKQELKVVPLQGEDSKQNNSSKSEESSSESEEEIDHASGSRRSTTLPQPVQKAQPPRNLEHAKSLSNKKSPLKRSRYQTSPVHKPPKFLFSRSTTKKNSSQQVSELKKPSSKPRDNSGSKTSTSKL